MTPSLDPFRGFLTLPGPGETTMRSVTHKLRLFAARLFLACPSNGLNKREAHSLRTL